MRRGAASCRRSPPSRGSRTPPAPPAAPRRARRSRAPAATGPPPTPSPGAHRRRATRGRRRGARRDGVAPVHPASCADPAGVQHTSCCTRRARVEGDRVRRRLVAATGGVSAAPLLVLFALNLVDEFDRVAFGVLSPEIRDTFGLSDSGIVAVGSIAGVTSLLAALPIGVLADRVRRVRLAAVGAATWGGFTILTALAPVTAVLTAARMGAGIGRIVNEPVHASLLTDFYPPTHHPRVFALHRLANPIGLGSALVVGLLATWFDWRWVFASLCIPTFLLLPFLLRLREPVRGESLDRDAALAASLRARAGFLEARRVLFGIPTLRRLWVGLPVVGIALITLPQLISLFFERVYGYGPTGRGVVTFLSGVGIVLGLGLGQRLATRALVAGCPERLATYDGSAIV